MDSAIGAVGAVSTVGAISAISPLVRACLAPHPYITPPFNEASSCEQNQD